VLSTIKKSLGYLRTRDKVKYLILVVFKAMAGLLDVIGIALIGVIAGISATNLDPNNQLEIAGFKLPIITEQMLIYLVIAVLIVFALKAIIAIWLNWVLSEFLSRLEREQATVIATSIFGEDLSKLQSLSRSEIIWAVTGSTNLAFSGLLTSFSTFVSEGVLLLLILVTFSIVDPMGAIFVVVYFGILVLLIQKIIGGSLRKAGEESSKGNIHSMQNIEDLLVAYREISIFHKTSFFLARFSNSRGELAKGHARMIFLGGMPRYVVETALMLGVVAFVGYQFFAGQLSTGLVAVGIFLTGGVRIIGSLLPLQNAAANVKYQTEQARLSLELLASIKESKIFEDTKKIIKLSPNLTKGVNPLSLRGLSVDVQNISFTYTGASSPALNNISFSIKSGDHVAIIGPSGAGKTTLVDLILGLVTPQSGTILIEGMPPKFVFERWPGKVSYVPQSPGIVSGTIAENVALGTDINEIDELRVISTLHKAGLGNFLDTLPEGIYTSVGIQADSLSGGQIQRLGFARALYDQPSLIVLDEATSALDASSEAHLSSIISDLGKEVTVIVIAHRLSTVQHSDHVFLMESGEITAQGTFAQLREKVPMVAEYVRLMSFDD
jgi:ABC-type multidrug transport system fused ATPase/permease subunit